MPAQATPCAGFLLAGGKSSRMGRDKALLQLGGRTLVESGLEKLNAVCAEVAIAGGAADLRRYGRLIEDTQAECGPLAGIVAALEQSEFEWNLFLPVDAPFVPVDVLKSLLLAAGGDEIGVMAEADDHLQPLIAVYSRRALPVLRQQLAAGRWKVTQAVAAAGSVLRVHFDRPEWFRNVNTPQEFVAARGHADLKK